MSLDWNLVRTILAHAEAETLDDFLKDAESLQGWKEGQKLSEHLDEKQPVAVRIVLMHLELLCEAGYLKGVKVSETADGFFTFGLGANPRLSLKGYSLLESLRTQGFLSKLKAYAAEKQVPLTVESIKTVASALLPTMLS